MGLAENTNHTIFEGEEVHGAKNSSMKILLCDLKPSLIENEKSAIEKIYLNKQIQVLQARYRLLNKIYEQMDSGEGTNELMDSGEKSAIDKLPE